MKNIIAVDPTNPAATMFYSGVMMTNNGWVVRWSHHANNAQELDEDSALDRIAFIQRLHPVLKGRLKIVNMGEIDTTDPYELYDRAMKGCT